MTRREPLVLPPTLNIDCIYWNLFIINAIQTLPIYSHKYKYTKVGTEYLAVYFTF